jgi:hypothetical protein
MKERNYDFSRASTRLVKSSTFLVNSPIAVEVVSERAVVNWCVVFN